MLSKYKFLLCIMICLSYEVVMSGCEVVWVNRNITDSFRVGENGCKNNASVCEITHAVCQPDGSCLCDSSKPNFRNPSLKIINPGSNDKVVSTNAYGCVDSSLLRFEEGPSSFPYCYLGPFEAISHSHENPASQHDIHQTKLNIKNCTFFKALVKFPNTTKEVEQLWLNGSYVDLTIKNKTLHLKWKRSVPALQGTIITFRLLCFNVQSKLNSKECLRIKVLGTWPWSADKNQTSQTSSPTTRPSNTIQNLPKKANTASSMDSDSDPDLKIIIIATVVPIILLIVLIVVVCLLCKHKKGTGRRNINKKGSAERRDSLSPKQFRHTDSCLQGADAYVNLPGTDTAQTFGAETNPGYRTDQRVVTQEKPAYATPDMYRKRDNNGENLHTEPGYEPVVRKKESKDSSFHEVPGYETPDVERKEAKNSNSHEVPGYETPDIERRANNDGTEDSAYSTPGRDAVDSGLSTANIKRVEVNGDMYALPDKKTRKINGLSYMDPSHLAPGKQEKTEGDDQSGQPTEYADIVGVMKDKPKKKK